MYNYLKLLSKIEDIERSCVNNKINMYLLHCKIECLSMIKANINESIDKYTQKINLESTNEIVESTDEIVESTTEIVESTESNELTDKFNLAGSFLGLNIDNEQNIAIEDFDVHDCQNLFDTFGHGLSSLFNIKDDKKKVFVENVNTQIKNENLTFEITKK